MMTLDEVRAKLKPMNLKEVSRGSGVHQNAIYRLMSGATKPSYQTVQKIVSYLETYHESDDKK